MGPDQEVFTVTQVPPGAAEAQRQRQVGYLSAMAVRTACFVLAMVTHGRVQMLMVAAAIVLPYLAVVVANPVRSRLGSSTVESVAEGADMADSRIDDDRPSEQEIAAMLTSPQRFSAANRDRLTIVASPVVFPDGVDDVDRSQDSGGTPG